MPVPMAAAASLGDCELWLRYFENRHRQSAVLFLHAKIIDGSNVGMRRDEQADDLVAAVRGRGPERRAAIVARDGDIGTGGD